MKKFLCLISLCIAYVSTASSCAHWQDSAIIYPLPKYTENFKDELTIAIQSDHIAITVPRKDAAYWLTPKDASSDKHIAHLIQSINFSKATIKELEALLHSIKSEYPYLKSLYESTAYITESHTLETHTLNALKQFSHQKKFYKLNSPCYNHITNNIIKVLVISIILHDIGKPLGLRAKQHEYTLPIAQEALKKWEFSPLEIKLSLTLIDNDSIGQLVQERYKKKPVNAHNELVQLSKNAQLPLEDYFTLQMLFFISDASSYPSIKSSAFKENKDNMLLPISKKFWELFIAINPKECFKLLSTLKSSF